MDRYSLLSLVISALVMSSSALPFDSTLVAVSDLLQSRSDRPVTDPMSTTSESTSQEPVSSPTSTPMVSLTNADVPAPVIPAVDPLHHSFDLPPATHVVVNDHTPEMRETQQKPEMYSMNVESRISCRFAKTTITSRVANPAKVSQEVFFSVIIPKTAFISGFEMEIDEVVYKAYVKEKEEAKQVYETAVKHGQSAAHVTLSARDSDRFSVSVNIEPQKKVTFKLNYEELLTRNLGMYSQIINLNPGQLVRDLVIDVFINETRNITEVKVPDFKTTNEIDPVQEASDNKIAKIERKSPTEVHIRFQPTLDDQKVLEDQRKNQERRKTSSRFSNFDIEDVKDDSNPGLGGQFIVKYDVEADPTGGEVVVNDGYFVHFFSPAELKPLNKHVVFVLDVSGSMSGRKIEQLREAMLAILDDLTPGDYFNIIEFSYSVTVRNLDSEAESAVFPPSTRYYNYRPYKHEEQDNPLDIPAFPANKEYIKKAKNIINKMTAGGGTNIYDALNMALKVAGKEIVKEKEEKQDEMLKDEPVRESGNKTNDKPEPIIIFLTDGEPTVGETRLQKISSAVHSSNHDPKVPVFSLAFGEGADYSFLKKLSLVNSGFARHIYEAADASLQLKNFYRQIASPLLTNVTFVYAPSQVDEESVTKTEFHNLFSGSELVVAGRISSLLPQLTGEVRAVSIDGPTTYFMTEPKLDLYTTPVQRGNPSTIERLWAYLSIRQLLDKQEAEDAVKEQTQTVPDPVSVDLDELTVTKKPEPKQTPKQKALSIALKYSFVTPLTSLVVVKPNEVKAVDSESASPGSDNNPVALPLYQKYRPAFASPGSGSGFGGSFTSFSAMYDPSAPLFAAPQYQTTRIMSAQPAMTLGTAPSIEAEIERFDTVFEEATTTLPTPLTLDDVTWLPGVSTNETDVILLPTGENGTDQTFRVGRDSVDESFQSCSNPAGPGECKHLEHCIIANITSDLQVFVSQYFCVIPGNFAGVCCPPKMEITETTTSPSTSSDTSISTESPKETTVNESTSNETAEDNSVSEEESTTVVAVETTTE